MQVEDVARARGEFELTLIDAEGKVKAHIVADNLIVTLGKEGICDQLLEAPSLNKPKYIAIGKSSTAPAAGNTALVEELKRKEGTRSRSGAVLTIETTFAAGEGTGELQEAGVLTASSGGTLYSRFTYGLITKEATDSLIVTWKLTIA